MSTNDLTTPSTPGPTVKETALAAAKAGWHVFPGCIVGKSKMSHKSAEHSDGRKWGATTDPEEIERDWQQWPDAMLGVVCGPKSNLFVVEIDTAEGGHIDGRANWEALIEANGPIPDTVQARSPSGSIHFYFRWPAELHGRLGNSAGYIAPGIDVRGEGGMVLAPPSYRADKGAAYEWVNPPTGYQLADCPGWLLELCVRPEPERKVSPAPSTPADLAMLKDLLTWIDPDEGGYDAWCNGLMAIHHATGGSVDGQALADDWSFQDAQEGWRFRGEKYEQGMVADKWRTFKAEGENPVTIATLWKRAKDAGAPVAEIRRRHGVEPPSLVAEDHFTAIVEADPSPFDAQLTERRPARLLPMINFEAAATAALTESARPLVKGLLDEGAFSVFYGPSNSGKTFVVLDLAYSISIGQDWGGMKTTKAPVLYIAAEGGGGIKKRIAALRQRPGATVPRDFYLSAASIDLRRPDGDVAAIIEAARSIGRVGLIVIDTLSRALAGGDETKDMGALVVNIDRIRQATGAHVLLVHHSGKDLTKGARGSSELRGAIDTEINIEGGVIRVTKQRDLEFGGDISFEIRGVAIGTDADGDVVTSATVSLQSSKRSTPKAPTFKEMEVLGVVRDLLSEGGNNIGVTANMVAGHYDAAGESMKADTARKHLQSLAYKSELRLVRPGRWAFPHDKTSENGPKSGNSGLQTSTYALPAYAFAAPHSEDISECGVFQ